jgi:hypothetical protein
MLKTFRLILSAALSRFAGGTVMAWIRMEVLEGIPELPKRVDFDDWEKDRGMVNLLSRKEKTKPWLPAGFYRSTKGGKLCVLEVHRSLKGVSRLAG